MKRLKTVINTIIWTLCGIYLCLITLLNIPAVQSFIARQAAHFIGNKINSEVSIGRVDLGLLNRIIIDNVKINDQTGKKALAATRLSAKISFTELSKGNIAISSAQVFGMNADIYKRNANAETNIQFIFDALASKDTTSSKPLNLEIGSLVIRHGRVRYSQLDSPDYRLTSMKHIDVGNISTHVVVNKITNDSINLYIKKLAFADKSGLEVKDFKLRLVANRKQATVDRLYIELPKSKIGINSVTASYDATSGKLLMPSVQYAAKIKDSYIYLPDLSTLVPQLANISNRVNIETEITGTSTSLNVSHLDIDTENGETRLVANSSLSNGFENPKWIANIQTLNISAETTKKVFKAFNKDKEMPHILSNIGNIAFNGSTGGTKADISLRGLLATAAGSIKIAASKEKNKITADLATQDCNLERILDNEKFGMLDTDIKISATMGKTIETATAEGLINKLQYNGYTYNNIDIDGKLDNRTISGLLAVNDDNIDINAEGNFNLDHPMADIKANIRHLRPKALNLSDKWKNADFQAQIDAKFAGQNIDNANGNINIRNFCIAKTDDDGNDDSYRISNINLISRNAEGRHSLILSSDFANAGISGEFNVQSIVQHVENMIADKLPNIQQLTPIKKQPAADCRMLFYADVYSAEPIRHLLGIPIKIHEPMRADGYINSRNSELSLQATIPYFSYNGADYTDALLNVSTPDNELKTTLSGKKVLSTGKKAEYRLDASAENNRLSASLNFDNNSKLHVKGNMNAYAQFSKNDNNEMEAVVNITPSKMLVDNANWNIKSSQIKYSRKHLEIDNFAIEHGDQHIHIDGLATASNADSLNINLKGVDVAYILNLVNFHSVEFGGKATGKATVSGVFDKLHAKADLTVDKFTFENGRMGTLLANVNWNHDEQQIDIDAKAHDEERLTIIKGYVSPKKNYIDLGISANDTRTEFLLGFCGSFIDEVDARANGEVRLWGPLNAIELTGDMSVDGNLHISSLNTEYTMSNGKIKLLEGEIQLLNDTIIDKNGNTGVVSGSLYHRHLGRLTYDIGVKTNNLLVYDFDGSDGSTFYGKAFGTGQCNIRGKSGEVLMDIDITPNAGSVMTYNTSSPDAIKSQEFIKWSDRDSLNIKAGGNDEDTKTVADMPSDIRINFLIHTQPTATLRLIMDQASGDYIDLRGSGVIRATYYNKGAFELFGNYLVDNGTYKLTIQNALHKDFEFQPGGTIAFGGNPYDAILNLQAMYPVNSVSLSDLQLGRSFTSNNIRVNCLMNITGTPNAPKVDFGLDMPTVSTDAKQMIYSLINSEEEMNQQVIYLLAVGRFYSQGNNNANADGTSQSQTSLAMQSILSGQISQQINSLLGTVIKNNNWNFGANISTGDEGWNNAEYEGLLSGRLLNNRLLINGQFGYRDNPNATTSFIGDFDIRYLLTPNGNVAVRVYNQSNDRYFTRNSLNTQGLGFILKKDFNLKWKKIPTIK